MKDCYAWSQIGGQSAWRVGSQWDALGLAGLVEAEVHEEGGGVLQAVHVEVGPGEVLRHQPGDQAPGQQGPPDGESVVIGFNCF